MCLYDQRLNSTKIDKHNKPSYTKHKLQEIRRILIIVI